MPVIGVDLSPARRDLAMRCGATHVLDPAAEDVIAAIKKIAPGGVDLAVEATGAPSVMADAINATRAQGGRAVVIGNARHGATLSLNPSVFNQGKSLLGTWGGDSVPDRDYARFGALAWLRPASIARGFVEALSFVGNRSGAQRPGAGQSGSPADRYEIRVRRNSAMRIGIDFDNTIVCYDGVFLRAAREFGLSTADLGASKNAVRDHLNNSGRADEFTRLQGYVYGSRMDLASCYPGVRRFLFAAAAAGHEALRHKP